MPIFSQLRRFLLTTTALVPLGLAPAAANPLGAQVVGGSATVQGQGTSSVTVTQQTNSAIVNWNTFNIAAGEKTKIFMPSASSVQLDRVTGGLGPSQIFGSLWSNGRVFLVNPDGILVGPGGKIDTASFLATTHDIANADFMAGRYNFSIPGRPDASVVNQGTITAQSGGFAALVAPGVRNSGTITARLGTIELAAGNAFTLDFYGDKLITLGVNDAIAATVKDVATGQPLSSLVSNVGKLKANGGTVELTAVAARQVVDSVINTKGVIEANTIGTHNGMIVLGAATAASKPADAPTQTVKVSGKLSAAGKKKGTTGGTIEVTGEAIALTGAKLDASGHNGGGTVLVGGDVGGGNPNPAVASIPQAQLQSYAMPTASTVTVDAATTINASATDAGDGGKVVVWSDRTTTFSGIIFAQGGANEGNGGFVEVSGKQTLNFNGPVDQSATNGRSGALLLDPASVTILFQGIGFLPGDNQSNASGVSGDGSTVIGNSGNTQGYRWTQAGGMIGFGIGTSPNGISDDGSVVVGGPRSPSSFAFRWTQATGMVSLGTLPGYNWSFGDGVSGNGLVAVGDAYNNGGSFQAFRWTQAGGMSGLGFIPGTTVSVAFGANSDGSIIVGYTGDSAVVAQNQQQAFRWTATTGMVSLGFLPGGNLSQATAVSADGSVIVGNSNFAGGRTADNMQAFRWTQAGGMVGLGFLSGANYAVASAVNADGSTIVGYSADTTIPNSPVNEHAFRWTQTNGLQSIQEVVQTAGITLTGWNLVSADGVSANGSTIVGRGTDPSGRTEAWILSFPSPTPPSTPVTVSYKPLLPAGTLSDVADFLGLKSNLNPPINWRVAASTPSIVVNAGNPDIRDAAKQMVTELFANLKGDASIGFLQDAMQTALSDMLALAIPAGANQATRAAIIDDMQNLFAKSLNGQNFTGIAGGFAGGVLIGQAAETVGTFVSNFAAAYIRQQFPHDPNLAAYTQSAIYFAFVDAAAAAQGAKVGGAPGAIAGVVIENTFVLGQAGLGLATDNITNYNSQIKILTDLIHEAKSAAVADPARAPKLLSAASDLETQLTNLQNSHPILNAFGQYGNSGLAPLGTLSQ